MTEKDYKVLYGEIIAKCWEDDEFKAKFLADPAIVMEDAGIPIEEGVEYKAIEAPKLVRYIVLPHENVAETVQELTKLLLSLSENENPVIVPEGTELRVLQNTEDLRYLVLHPSPDTLTAAELDMIAGGGGKNAAVNVNYAVNCNVAAVVNVEAVANATTAMQVAEAAAVVVVAGVVVFI